MSEAKQKNLKMDPWKLGAVITPSDNLVDQFHKWDKTKSKDKRMRSFNRAKQWICRLLNRPFSVQNSHKMRQEDVHNALDHMISTHARGISHVNYLISCIKDEPVNTVATPAQITSESTEEDEDFKDATADFDTPQNESKDSNDSKNSSELSTTPAGLPSTSNEVTSDVRP